MVLHRIAPAIKFPWLHEHWMPIRGASEGCLKFHLEFCGWKHYRPSPVLLNPIAGKSFDPVEKFVAGEISPFCCRINRAVKPETAAFAGLTSDIDPAIHQINQLR